MFWAISSLPLHAFIEQVQRLRRIAVCHISTAILARRSFGSNQLAREFRRERLRDRAARKAPTQIVMFVVASTWCVCHLNSALLVKPVHRIEALSQAAKQHGDFHNVREGAGNGLRTCRLCSVSCPVSFDFAAHSVNKSLRRCNGFELEF